MAARWTETGRGTAVTLFSFEAAAATACFGLEIATAGLLAAATGAEAGLAAAWAAGAVGTGPALMRASSRFTWRLGTSGPHRPATANPSTCDHDVGGEG